MKDIDETKAPLLDHLIELRKRLLYCVIGLAAAFAVAFYFADEIFAFLTRPLLEAFGDGQNGRLVYTKLYEAFFVEIKVALFAAFLAAFPLRACIERRRRRSCRSSSRPRCCSRWEQRLPIMS